MGVRTLIPLACVGLHTLLVLAHVALLGVWAANAERSVVIFPEKVSSTQTYITVASQAIIIVSMPLMPFPGHSRSVNILSSPTQSYLSC